jgi:hypothetical protein
VGYYLTPRDPVPCFAEVQIGRKMLAMSRTVLATGYALEQFISVGERAN